MNKGYPPMMKMIKIQTILLALLVNMTVVVFGQDNKPATGVMKASALQASETLQAAEAAVQDAQKGQEKLVDQPVEGLHNNEEKVQVLKNNLAIIWKWISDKWEDLLTNIIAGIITWAFALVFSIILLLIHSLKRRNKLFCKDDFAVQIQNCQQEKKKETLKERLKNTYVRVEDDKGENGYKNARHELWGDNKLQSGIFVIGGKLFTGRHYFLDRELINHKTDVFEVEEDNWLDRTKQNLLNDMLLKRLFPLCRRWEIPINGRTHKAVILMGESLTMPELDTIVKNLAKTFKKKKRVFCSVNLKKLTLIIKTNIRFVNESINDETIPVKKLEFNQLSRGEVLRIFKNGAWDSTLQTKISNDLEKSPFYNIEFTSDNKKSSAFEIALWINTFGQPKAIKALYQQESAKSNEHWRNIFTIWNNICNNHGISLENFLAFLWMVATLRKDKDTTDPYNILANIATIKVGNKNTSQKPWFEWDPGLYQLLKEILGEEAVSNFDFVGDKPNQLDEFEWAAFLMKMLEADNSFTEPVHLTTVFENIKHLLPHFSQVLGLLPNDKSWTHYKNIIANNLIEACIIINRFEERDHVLGMLVEFLEDKKSFAGANCKRIKEIAGTLKEMRKQRRKDFDFLFYLEENWSEWSALERNGFLNAYLGSKIDDAEYLKALMNILPLLLAFKCRYNSVSDFTDIFLTLKTKYTDLIFDFRENGQLRRVFQISADQLSADDKIRKFMGMKVLEIIFNHGLDMRDPESYMGDDWKNMPYNPVSLGAHETTWRQFVEALIQLHEFKGYELSDDDKHNRLLEINRELVDTLTTNGIIAQSALFRDMRRLVIAEFINKYIKYVFYFDKSLEILKSSNILLPDDYLSDYIRNVMKMADQLHLVFQGKGIDARQIHEFNTHEYTPQESIAFLVLVKYYYLFDKLTVIEDWNSSYVETIYHECFNCFMKLKESRDSSNVLCMSTLSVIIMGIPTETISRTSTPTIMSFFDKRGLEYIYSTLKSIVFNEMIWDLYRILISSYKLQSDKMNEDLSNKVYLVLSRIMIIKPEYFSCLNETDKEDLDTLQTDEWRKPLATSLGELVYQQIAWIFDEHSSFNEEELIEFRGEMDDGEFFQSSLEEFAKHEIPQDARKLEEIAFLCCVIAAVIGDLRDEKKLEIDIYNKYRSSFEDFLVRKVNHQPYTMNELFNEFEKKHNWLPEEDAKSYRNCMIQVRLLLNIIRIQFDYPYLYTDDL